MYPLYSVIVYQAAEYRPPKYHGMAARVFASTSHRRLDLIPWYTSGFQ